SQPALVNVAIGKTATQSSDWSASYPASNAVDGNTNTDWYSGSCTSTKDNQNAWWKVDLGGNYLVHEVIVTNRLDCCESQPALENVAIGKTATQSSDWSASYPASNAVDGNTHTNWNSGSCTSTKDNQNAWWKVDLGGNYLVHEVIVTNRLDCCETRILNAEIRVGLSDDISVNSQCGEKITSSQTSQANIHIQCNSPIVGRYVSMQLVDRSDLLNFCEMQVMAEGSQPALVNVAIGKTATQSSDWSASYPASNAVDGNTNTNWNSGSCTSTKDNQNAWWKVDLGGNYLVHEVIVTNRLDCC
uniref:Pentraxin fusion protein-like n=1 Tax=Saccoglossus kowalevskii TaxID=10224 RepID=A0ABM0MTL4_SACKO